MKIKLITLILLTLWIPVTVDKVMDFEIFKTGILKQPFDDTLGYILIYTLPLLEGLTILFLLIPQMQYYGMLLSLGLMLVFTTYVGLALGGAWEELPCGCGSVMSWMNWEQHFWFNLCFTALSGWGFYLVKLKRGRDAGDVTAEGVPA